MLRLSDPLPRWDEAIVSEYTIGHLELFRFDCKQPEQNTPDKTGPCCRGLLKLSSGCLTGWAEYEIPAGEACGDFARWASVWIRLKGLTIPAAAQYIQAKREAWGPERFALAESAVSDLAANVREPYRQGKDAGVSIDRSRLIECSQAYFGY